MHPSGMTLLKYARAQLKASSSALTLFLDKQLDTVNNRATLCTCDTEASYSLVLSLLFSPVCDGKNRMPTTPREIEIWLIAKEIQPLVIRRQSTRVYHFINFQRKKNLICPWLGPLSRPDSNKQTTSITL